MVIIFFNMRNDKMINMMIQITEKTISNSVAMTFIRC